MISAVGIGWRLVEINSSLLHPLKLLSEVVEPSRLNDLAMEELPHDDSGVDSKAVGKSPNRGGGL